ncbi:hypothetical protein [Methanocella arvoryzae]|uniref:DUF4352 domain-containing protein n=1 Tax=Methanocella arvoryzae (strain DSM 22066 / NBRC 105507 / MRE50) TaxID=351160 RepID=Q0W713_METAR|nr:hypothetical protein [Methanocella arvoryzae]CAJ35830.1 hypothetical protein RCIX389 [Methanocella arvoryzae MRE50]
MNLFKVSTFVLLLLVTVVLCGCCCFTGNTSSDSGSTVNPTASTSTYSSQSQTKVTPTPVPTGFAKANPAPIGTTVQFKAGSIPESKIQITCIDAKRGAEAYNLINDNDGYTYMKPAEPDAGEEYLIVKYKVEFIDYKVGDTPKSYYISGSDFTAYSPDNTREYDHEWFTTMEPELSKELFKGDSTIGWVTFCVKEGYDHYLIGFNNDKIWFTV